MDTEKVKITTSSYALMINGDTKVFSSEEEMETYIKTLPNAEKILSNLKKLKEQSGSKLDHLNGTDNDMQTFQSLDEAQAYLAKLSTGKNISKKIEGRESIEPKITAAKNACSNKFNLMKKISETEIREICLMTGLGDNEVKEIVATFENNPTVRKKIEGSLGFLGIGVKTFFGN